MVAMVGRFFRSALRTGIPFGILMSVYYMVTSDDPLVRVIASGALAGVVFGALMAAFLELQHRGGARYDPTGPGEELIRWQAARREQEDHSASGHLYLTGERLVFVAHEFSRPSDGLSMPLQEISSVRAGRSMGVLPNAVEVVRGGVCDRFVVGDRRGWIRQLRQRMSRDGG